jgi:ATP-dependent Clp protease ATP-binding subunit ClpC
MNDLSKRAKHILEIAAQAEGRRLKSESIGPEHVFLAILSDDSSSAAQVLERLGVNADVIKRAIEHSMRFNSANSFFGTLPVNSRYNRIVDLARNEARKCHAQFVGTEHLLLALFRDGATRGVDALAREGIDYGVVYNEVIRVTGGRKDSEPADKKDPRHSSVVNEYSSEITALARENKLDPVIGRDTEIARILRILCRKTKNNPMLIGEAGVGKTAIVEGLAQRIIEGKVPALLKGKRLVSLDIASIVAGTKYRGDFEDRMKKFMKEALADGSYIIFIDEIHMIMGAGAAEGSIDAANILKPFLARGDLQCIGATTIREYKKHIEKDPALERRFQTVLVEEPSAAEATQILFGIKKRYEEHHHVIYTDEAIHEAVVLSKRYIHDRFLPDKAIDIIDESGAHARIISEDTPDDIRGIEQEIEHLQESKVHHVTAQEFEQAAADRDRIQELRRELSERQKRWSDREGEYLVTVDKEQIRSVVSQWTGIPVSGDDTEGNVRLLSMETVMKKTILGQDAALAVVARAIRRSRSGIRSGRRPAGTFLFAGPSGVGKTECAKVLAEFLFGDRDALVRFDMSEYMEKHAVARLIGSPPGYIGFEEGGQLVDRIRRRPYSVILFDEIEKAHPDLFNILLQMFEEGEITDGTGRKASLRETIIVLTSNVGNSRFDRTMPTGFGRTEGSRSEKISEEIRSTFNPELINRIDEIVVFDPLDVDSIQSIVRLMLDELSVRSSQRGHELFFDPEITGYLASRSDSARSGARKIRRMIQSSIEDRIAELLLSGKVPEGRTLYVRLEDDSIVVTPEERRSGKEQDSQGVTV